MFRKELSSFKNTLSNQLNFLISYRKTEWQTSKFIPPNLRKLKMRNKKVKIRNILI